MPLTHQGPLTFDPTPRGRNDVLKNKWTLVCLTEFHRESEKRNRLSHRELFFLTHASLKKTDS